MCLRVCFMCRIFLQKSMHEPRFRPHTGGACRVVLQSSFGVHFNPVCAVVGGFLAQDVIKFLTHKDIPTNNYFLYDGLETHGALIEEVQPTSVA